MFQVEKVGKRTLEMPIAYTKWFEFEKEVYFLPGWQPKNEIIYPFASAKPFAFIFGFDFWLKLIACKIEEKKNN